VPKLRRSKKVLVGASAGGRVSRIQKPCACAAEFDAAVCAGGVTVCGAAPDEYEPTPVLGAVWRLVVVLVSFSAVHGAISNAPPPEYSPDGSICLIRVCEVSAVVPSVFRTTAFS
jgi:hypothetical protein